MSDALDYLVKARPDALAPYLKFMKEAGIETNVYSPILLPDYTAPEVKAKQRQAQVADVTKLTHHLVIHRLARSDLDRTQTTPGLTNSYVQIRRLRRHRNECHSEAKNYHVPHSLHSTFMVLPVYFAATRE